MKRLPLYLAGISGLIALAGCGGGGGVASAGSTPTPTPTPTNSLITALKTSQTFNADDATSNVSIDLTSQQTGSAATTTQSIQVAYDATANSYTITAPGRAQTFAPADVQTGTLSGETRYARTTSNARDYLTIVTTPYSGSTSNKYVALGYMQHNDLSAAGSQATTFDAFTFGLETPAASVPKSGSASWITDVFGFYTAPGAKPRTIQGSGDFTVNFTSALFTTRTSVQEFDFLTGGSVSGGGIEVDAQGHLGSGNTFTGNMSYGGSLGSVSGTISGRFYGPGADEIGAAFRADNGTGTALVGALTGQRNPATTPTNFTLGSITTDQLFYSIWSTIDGATSASGTGFFAQSPLYGQTTLHPDGSFQISPPNSSMPSLTFSEADRIASTKPDFASYQKTFDGTAVRVDLYRPGTSSQGLVLTYAGFGDWSRTNVDGSVQHTVNGYFDYGFATPSGLLAGRTGTGHYEGIAIGTAGATDGSRYDVSGISRFDVNFSGQNYTGSLALNATPEKGGTTAAFGTWQFAAPLSSGNMTPANLNNGGTANPFNNISPQFFGPDGEEIAAPFTIATGAKINGVDVTVAGVAAAKRQ